MILQNNHILVRVDPEQKVEMKVGEIRLMTAQRYNENHRERSPVMAEVLEGNDKIPTGSWLICSYTHFDKESYYYIWDDLYSIPVDEMIFAIIAEDGSLDPVMDNIFVDRKWPTFVLEVPRYYVKPLFNQGYVAKTGCGFEKGQEILWLDMADHEIIYYWKGEYRTAIKVEKAEIVGFVKKQEICILDPK